METDLNAFRSDFSAQANGGNPALSLADRKTRFTSKRRGRVVSAMLTPLFRANRPTLSQKIDGRDFELQPTERFWVSRQHRKDDPYPHRFDAESSRGDSSRNEPDHVNPDVYSEEVVGLYA